MKESRSKEIKHFRAELRKVFKNNEETLAIFGYRIARKKRAKSNRALRAPTSQERRNAARMRTEGMSAHAVEQYFNKEGVRMTRNRQSKDDGAR